MTQDEIIEMARQASGEFYVTSGNQTPTWYFPHSTIYDFAELVSAKEREACAKIIQTHLDANDYLRTKGSLASVLDYIRARGEQA